MIKRAQHDAISREKFGRLDVAGFYLIRVICCQKNLPRRVKALRSLFLVGLGFNPSSAAMRGSGGEMSSSPRFEESQRLNVRDTARRFVACASARNAPRRSSISAIS